MCRHSRTLDALKMVLSGDRPLKASSAWLLISAASARLFSRYRPAFTHEKSGDRNLI
jgi:hypothetical protein